MKVQVVARLVEQQQVGLGQQRAGQGEYVLLTARQRADLLSLLACQPHARQHRAGLVHEPVAVHPVESVARFLVSVEGANRIGLVRRLQPAFGAAQITRHAIVVFEQEVQRRDRLIGVDVLRHVADCRGLWHDH